MHLDLYTIGEILDVYTYRACYILHKSMFLLRVTCPKFFYLGKTLILASGGRTVRFFQATADHFSPLGVS